MASFRLFAAKRRHAKRRNNAIRKDEKRHAKRRHDEITPSEKTKRRHAKREKMPREKMTKLKSQMASFRKAFFCLFSLIFVFSRGGFVFSNGVFSSFRLAFPRLEVCYFCHGRRGTKPDPAPSHTHTKQVDKILTPSDKTFQTSNPLPPPRPPHTQTTLTYDNPILLSDPAEY